ncbi:alpha/beta fold hydrolase [Kineosporia babensis]|uniref:Alpha/beta fold hydrolase n=1 Tax=Kineosporia babensis TaxID=499548 RepID=A0A9X1NIX6_9ACTN|nr:alpha/beta fold hydrolase [Kineosporia babensis]MCD5315892.1 alpha/beta fold hydrolase [Kineosporia babensis]
MRPVLGTAMYLHEVGNGRPVLFLHGNPTSSYLWRHVIAGRRPGWRCLAPDLIGMGRSARPAGLGYTFTEHAEHLDALLEDISQEHEPEDGVGTRDTDLTEDALAGVVVVGHDWGVALALELLRRRPEQISAVAVMEGHIQPLPGWEAFDPGGRELFQQLRTPGVGERMVLEENIFLERLLPAALQRSPGTDVLKQYASPYPDAASRRALLSWPRQIPIAGQPAETHAALNAAAQHASVSPVPKLLITAPGTPIVTPQVIDWCTRHLPHLTVAAVPGPAGHFLPEDQPDAVTDVLWQWLETLT